MRDSPDIDLLASKTVGWYFSEYNAGRDYKHIGYDDDYSERHSILRTLKFK